MKQIIENAFIKVFRFASATEATTFFKNQKVKKSLLINDFFGDSYYCYVCYHSLTREKLYAILFSSDEDESNLNFFIWDNLMILDTGKNIYLLDENLKIKSTLEITTPLIGLYLINKGALLILEEAYMRVINYNGEIVKSELFDLIKDYSIKDNLLSIQINEEIQVIELT